MSKQFQFTERWKRTTRATAPLASASGETGRALNNITSGVEEAHISPIGIELPDVVTPAALPSSFSILRRNAEKLWLRKGAVRGKSFNAAIAATPDAVPLIVSGTIDAPCWICARLVLLTKSAGYVVYNAEPVHTETELVWPLYEAYLTESGMIRVTHDHRPDIHMLAPL